MSARRHLSAHIRTLHSLARRYRAPSPSESSGDPLWPRLVDVCSRTWDLGFTAFGGPPVHFKILYERFVEGKGGESKWVDEQTYQELFALCQGLPGPASTKMLFCLAFCHAGCIPAILVFFLWSLPGAIGMFSLALGVRRIGEVLPGPVYALLSGLNASTVGIIALAAVQLADKTIRDKLSRILVIFGACAGLCYAALWYFPVLILIGGLVTLIWDGFLGQQVGRFRARLQRRRRRASGATEEEPDIRSLAIEALSHSDHSIQRRNVGRTSTEPPALDQDASGRPSQPADILAGQSPDYLPRVNVGISLAVVFFASLISLSVARVALKTPPLAFKLAANMHLAGTVIFGGGPVVIPLLRSYVVDPGWVSPRDFLLGLAIIQAFPGPNFNFAVYLGALAIQSRSQIQGQDQPAITNSNLPSILGAIISFIGIFSPGILLAAAIQSFWGILRKRKWVIDILRGVNATAVGLVFTAVYRLWEIGYLSPDHSRGQPLTSEPWWVVVSVLTYAESAWFGVPPPLAICFGAILGLCWFAAVGR